MNFSDVHIDIPETQVFQLAVYGDVLNNHSMNSILRSNELRDVNITRRARWYIT